MKKGMRKVWICFGFLIVLTGVYCFAAPHDTPTFSAYATNLMVIFTGAAAALTTEHFSGSKEAPPQA